MRHKKKLVIVASFLADKRQDGVVGDPVGALALLLELLQVFHFFHLTLRLAHDHAPYIDSVWFNGHLFDELCVLQGVENRVELVRDVIFVVLLVLNQVKLAHLVRKLVQKHRLRLFIKRGQHFDHVHDLVRVVHLVAQQLEDSHLFVVFHVRDVEELFRSELVRQHFLKLGEVFQIDHFLDTILVEAPHDALGVVCYLF